ncbi:MAG: hypothetical protein ACPGGA_03050 [Balneolaceae bacterium]
MDGNSQNLGLCFFSDRLYYALNQPDEEATLREIGSFDFNFDIAEAIRSQHPDHFPHIQKTVEELVKENTVTSLRALTSVTDECWTALPKVVYDNADEREDHLSIIMKGVSREDIEPIWHAVSKTQYKFLCIRRRSVMDGLNKLALSVGTNDYSSDFEIASAWTKSNISSASFMMIGCHKHAISVTSFVLGQFRAATFIKFDDVDDLPYHWLQASQHSSWLMGIHDHTYLFGYQTHEVERVLNHFWDKSTKAVPLNTLDEMGVMAEETTYGFDLAEAFPAILLSLG